MVQKNREIRTCHIVGAGEFNKEAFKPEPGDYIIAADGGYNYVISRGFYPDAVIGDFDSLKRVPEHKNIIRHPVRKDDTDTLLSVKIALDAGYERIILHGGTGGRVDHTIANFQTLSFIAARDAECFLIGREYIACAVKDGSLLFNGGYTGTVSVFCMGETAHGVYLKGFKYPLENVDLHPCIPIGVSNEFLKKPAQVRVDKGILTVLWYDISSPLPQMCRTV